MHLDNPVSPGKHLRIYETLAADILSGRYQSGQQIPTLQKLSVEFGVSHPTIIRAIGLLEQRGLVMRRQGAGVFVRDVTGLALQGRTLGLLMPDLLTGWAHFGKSLFSEIVSSLIASAKKRQLSVSVDTYSVCHKEVLSDLQRSFDNFQSQNVAGVLFYYVNQSGKEAVGRNVEKILDGCGLPIVLLDRDIASYPSRSRYDVVGVNNERASYALTEHLIGTGCRKFCFLTTSFDTHSPVVVERIQGYQSALLRHNLDPHQIAELPFGDEPATARILETLVRRDGVEALVCLNDEQAALCVRLLLAMGIRIPDDVRLVGFDDMAIAQTLPVPLTTIHQPLDAIASEAIVAMAERIAVPGRAARDILLVEKLVVRDSCGARRNQ